MSDLPQNVDFLHDFLSWVCVLHISFVDGLDRNVPACQFVNPKGDLSERTFANQFDKLVEL